jgi:hypothetical protein
MTTRYGDKAFAEAATLPLKGGLADPRRLIRLLWEAVRHPRTIAAFVQVVLRRPPSLRVSLSGSAPGRELVHYFDARSLRFFRRNHLFQAVLTLPDTYAEYLRGHHRQAVRTNLRRASEEGIHCRELGSRAETLAAWREVMVARIANAGVGEGVERALWQLIQRPEITNFASYDAGGDCVAAGAVVIDSEVALIRSAVAASHHARWCLHAHIVRRLCDGRVRYLLVDFDDGSFGALAYPPNIRYFQRLLGYELAHVTANRRANGRHRRSPGGLRRGRGAT